MYAAADLHLGTRMHSDILAMSAGTPAVAIAYEDKTVGLMEMMDLRDLLLDIESLAAPELEAVLARAWDDRRALRARLAPKVADLRGRARRNLELMREAADRLDATRRA
jgi:colanic acid/amylovoran biosynthesis protein